MEFTNYVSGSSGCFGMLGKTITSFRLETLFKRVQRRDKNYINLVSEC